MQTLLVGVVGLAGVSAFAGCGGEDEPSLVVSAESAQSSSARAPDDCAEEDGVPTELRCAGLYADWDSRTIDPEALAFTPAFQLWSDGAAKSRWLILPRGKGVKIDVRDMNGWVFPVGTKLFKEFRLTLEGRERRIETRMLWKRETGWVATKYIWSPTEDVAKRVTTSFKPYPELTTYEAPSDGSCDMCHRGSRDRVLGFSAVLLAAPEAEGTTYTSLLDKGLLDGDAPDASMLQIPGDEVSRDAIGRLHVGCGLNCHNPNNVRQFQMRVEVTRGQTPARVEDTSVIRTGLGRPSGYGGFRIAAGDETRSAVFRRMAVRGAGQMPPIATKVKDDVTLDVVRRWIRAMQPATP